MSNSNPEHSQSPDFRLPTVTADTIKALKAYEQKDPHFLLGFYAEFRREQKYLSREVFRVALAYEAVDPEITVAITDACVLMYAALKRQGEMDALNAPSPPRSTEQTGDGPLPGFRLPTVSRDTANGVPTNDPFFMTNLTNRLDREQPDLFRMIDERARSVPSDNHHAHEDLAHMCRATYVALEMQGVVDAMVAISPEDPPGSDTVA
ncbi:MAG TPA: hypothetical protein VMB52_00100 [Verrucomicrobiae bacterium]|nr:hypothetical protein [Verrucomicrobiae bacterium]